MYDHLTADIAHLDTQSDRRLDCDQLHRVGTLCFQASLEERHHIGRRRESVKRDKCIRKDSYIYLIGALPERPLIVPVVEDTLYIN